MALSRHHSALHRPSSVEEIAKEAQSFEFNPARPLQQWLRAAKMLLTEAAVCEQDGNLQMAYLYLYRHAELVLTRLPDHPDYKDPSHKNGLVAARKAIQTNLVKLEQWKPRIEQEFQRYVVAMQRRKARLRNSHDSGRGGPSRTSSDVDPDRKGSMDEPMYTLDAFKDSSLAVNLAQREIRRRDASKRETARAGIDPGTVAARRHGFVVHEGDETMEGVREAGKHLHSREHRRKTSESQHPSTKRDLSSTYQYPAVPTKEGSRDWAVPPLRTYEDPSPISAHDTSVPPPIPSKELLDSDTSSAAPAIPPKTALSRDISSASSAPAIPQKYTFTPTATTESDLPLRPLLLPPGLRESFLRLAARNTARNVETCGVLACTPHAGALFVTHLVVPGQTATADTCDTTAAGDEALFAYCDTHALLVCGWIHTHPSQSCFLSSRDLHTSAGYQVMLPEAVAIVCAPRQSPDWGVFRLTDPPGLGHVLDCRRPGTFHPHGIDGLYTDALGGRGHVIEGPGLEFEVVDMRDSEK